MTKPRLQFVEGDGVGIWLALWEGTQPTVLCVHGLTANCRCWDTIAAEIAPQCTIAAPDLRGRGRSEQPPSGYSIDWHCRDIDAILAELRLDRIALVGHSLGAMIALTYAVRRPDRVDRLVLIDGAGSLDAEQTQKVFEGIRPALERLGTEYPDVQSYLNALRRTPYLQPWTSRLERYFEYELESTPGGVRCRIRPETIAEEIENLKQAAPADLYPQVRCPTLILRATRGMLAADDLVLPPAAARRMTAEIPDARCVDVPGTNHYSIVLQPNRQRKRELLGFLTPPRPS